MKLDEEGHRILAEARANVERLKGSEQRFAADREAILKASEETGPLRDRVSQTSVESRNQRHCRELDEQEKQFENERVMQKRAERHRKKADWTQWERWADAKIAAAIAAERRVVCATLGDEVRKAIVQIYDDIADEVKGLQREIVVLKSTLDRSFEELRSVAKTDNAKVIDMPNPLRRAN
jgi:hypothetical protein